MLFKYTGNNGIFYGRVVEPNTEYDLTGEQERLAKKSPDFKIIKTKTRKQKGE